MQRWLPRLLLGILILLCLAGSARVVSAQSFGAGELIAAVNALRAAQGLAPYAVDSGLMAYAQEHSDYQARTGISTHVHSDGTSSASRGIQENIAAGNGQFMSVDFIINQIWADASHRGTMTGYAGGSVGAGIASSGDTIYVTLNVRPSGGAAPSSSKASISAGQAQPTSVPQTALATSTPRSDGSIAHVVGYGESLWSIAIAYGVKIDEIRALNGLAAGATDIYSGQKLLIRGPGTVTATLEAPASTATPTRTAAPTATLRPTRTPRLTASPTVLQQVTPSAPARPAAISPAGLVEQVAAWPWRTIVIWGVFLCAGGLLVVFLLTFRK